MNHVAIVDYGSGNLGSIRNMIERIGFSASIAETPQEILTAERLILPGVGAFDTGMRELQRRGLVAPLTERVLNDNAPVLGICLGAQMMTQGSEEGLLPGLGWFNAETVKFNFTQSDARLPLPNMGWRGVEDRAETGILVGMEKDAKFYFVHNFHIAANDCNEAALVSFYGYEFIAGLRRDNIFAVQFHPEKSHRFGMLLFENFLNV